MEKNLSIGFGLLIGGMWMGGIVLGNLGGAPVFGNLRDIHPRIYAIAGWCALGAVFFTALGALVGAYRTGKIASGLRVGIWSGLISGGMVCITGIGLLVFFHEALMKDPSNIQEFARSAHRSPTETELSSFLFWEGLAGAVNHLWIGPLLGVTVGESAPSSASCSSSLNGHLLETNSL
jgi:hypothetical protein